ncbi:tyrosine-protein phosphatase [Glycomyces buryatensis]|uniref:Tyrosine-protein phosphatase n=1 Tax=Glycomyces buryatensis TaxID=2570927 RepID=A0A4S8QPG6_9ACTN|nr:tyrosine-protein phosphatase [Glycomyces buryatensis]THV42604.1 tyrosine-protein phosphatase [Glycomyces buryatensis]
MSPDFLPPQFIPTEQIFNLRDVGGWNGADGAKVKSGIVFRSDNFGSATAADLDRVVNELGIRHVIDLRRHEELEATGRFPEIDSVTFHHLELLHIKWELIGVDYPSGSAESEIVRFLRHRYSGMLEAGYQSISDSLDVIARGEPVVFHCMAGKDRTGILAAVLLSILGVSDDDIAADYELSNVGIARWRAYRDATWGKPEIDGGLSTPAEAMRQTIAEMNDRFGSLENYAIAAGFNKADLLRERLLE